MTAMFYFFKGTLPSYDVSRVPRVEGAFVVPLVALKRADVNF